MVTVGASGREVVLRAGDYRARIVTVGAGLAGLYQGHERSFLFGVDGVPALGPGYASANRVAGKRLRGRVSYDLPSTSALSAHLCTALWPSRVGNRRGRRLLGAPPRTHPSALPCRGRARCVCALQPGSGAWPERRTVGNRHPLAAPPHGVGFHPYWLSTVCGWTLELENPASIILPRPTPPSPVAPDVASFSWTSFPTSSVPPTGPRVCRRAPGPLRDPASGVGVSLSSDAPWLQVYSADAYRPRGRCRRA